MIYEYLGTVFHARLFEDCGSSACNIGSLPIHELAFMWLANFAILVLRCLVKLYLVFL